MGYLILKIINGEVSEMQFKFEHLDAYAEYERQKNDQQNLIVKARIIFCKVLADSKDNS